MMTSSTYKSFYLTLSFLNKKNLCMYLGLLNEFGGAWVLLDYSTLNTQNKGSWGYAPFPGVRRKWKCFQNKDRCCACQGI